MLTDTHDNIVKAQKLYRTLIECDTPQAFKKAFGDAIQRHTLDEFYLVVVRAEFSAALTLAERARAGDGFSFSAFLAHFCGLKPGHLLGLPLQVIADITETPQDDITRSLRDFGYTLNAGVIAGHPECAPRHVRKDAAAEDRAVVHAG